MRMRRTLPLSIKGSREVIEEMNRPPEDTPERRRIFQIAREVADVVEDAIRSTESVSPK